MISIKSWIVFLLAVTALGWSAAAAKKARQPEISALDRYVQDATQRGGKVGSESSPGSAWTPASRLSDLGSDLRATQVDDLVTIIVSEKASAVSTGSTKTARASSAKASVTALAGKKSAVGTLANLAGSSANTQLNGQGTTSRDTTLTTRLSARVTHVLPNGYLVVEGDREIQVNSEHQLITVRGVVRPVDLSPGNIVSSDHLAQLEVRINGKGVVNDAVRRPFFLYRILLGLLPF